MTPQEIKQQRDFLDAGLKGKQTAAPCQGCGRQVLRSWGERKPYPWREADKVCPACQKLLREALNAREDAGRQDDYRRYFVNFDHFTEGRYRHHWNFLGSGEEPEVGKHPPSDIIRKALFRLAESLAGNLPDTEGGDSEPLTKPKQSMHGPRGKYLWLRPGDAAKLALLDAAIRSALLERTECGEEYGRNLLAQLATGEMSVQKFNEITIEQKR